MAKGEMARAHNIASRAALRYEEGDDLKLAGSWRRAVSSTLYYVGKYDEAALEAERSAEIQPDPYERALSLILLAQTHTWRLKSNEAFSALGRVEEIARSFSNDVLLRAQICSSRGIAFGAQGDVDQAIVELEGAAALMCKSDRLWAAAGASNNLGFWLARERRFNEAEQRLVFAHKLLEKDPNLHLEAAIYDSLGQLYTLMGRHASAERLLREAVRVFQRLPDNVLFVVSLLHLSELHQHMRQYQSAREEAACALKLATDTKLNRLSAKARGLLLAVESDSSCHSRSKNPNVQRVGDLIKENPNQKLTLKQMARATNVSSSRLSHLFKTETGTSPAKYMKSARMREARNLLETTSLSVKEITFRIGLADESHFVRDFKKSYGLPPARYRKRFLAENEMMPKAATLSGSGSEAGARVAKNTARMAN